MTEIQREKAFATSNDWLIKKISEFLRNIFVKQKKCASEQDILRFFYLKKNCS